MIFDILLCAFTIFVIDSAIYMLILIIVKTRILHGLLHYWRTTIIQISPNFTFILIGFNSVIIENLY